MQIFEDDPFFKQSEVTVMSQKRQTTTANEEFANKFSSVQDQLLSGRLSDVFHSQIRFFPANNVMVQAMYKLMKPNGVLTKEGFSYYG